MIISFESRRPLKIHLECPLSIKLKPNIIKSGAILRNKPIKNNTENLKFVFIIISIAKKTPNI